MNVSIIQVPYHIGQPEIGSAQGPLRIVAGGIQEKLVSQGLEPSLIRVERSSHHKAELIAVLDVNKRLAEAIRECRGEKRFPLVLAGDCTAALGILAGLGGSPVGVVWFDAHGDFNTPETSPSGYFGGMPLAVALGLCYHDLRASIGLPHPLHSDFLILVGTRDLDPGERANIERSRVNVLGGPELNRMNLTESLIPYLDQIAKATDRIYLHVDLDVLDPREAPGVDFPCPDGISQVQLNDAIGLIADRFVIDAACLTAYNPNQDKEDRTLAMGVDLAEWIASLAAA